MSANIKQLRQIVKEAISETYFGLSTNFGGLDSPAYNKAGSMQKRKVDRSLKIDFAQLPIDEVALTEKLLSIFLSIPNIPQSDDSHSEPSVMENDVAVVIRAHIGGDAGFPVGDFGDRAFNHAASESAKALIENPEDLEGAASACARALLSPDTEYDRASTRMYEEIIAFPRNLK